MDEYVYVDWLDQVITIKDGALVRSFDADPYFVAIGYCDTHTILFHRMFDNNQIEDFIDSIITGLPDIAEDYLDEVLSENDNVLVHWSKYKDAPSAYDIYYDFTGDNDSIEEILNWMQLNSDFAATNYRYTEIKDGKQTVIAPKGDE